MKLKKTVNLKRLFIKYIFLCLTFKSLFKKLTKDKNHIFIHKRYYRKQMWKLKLIGYLIYSVQQCLKNDAQRGHGFYTMAGYSNTSV